MVYTAPILIHIFQDGTINYLSLPVVSMGLRLLRSYLPLLPVRLSTLLHYLATSLSELRYPTGTPVACILSHMSPEPTKQIGDASPAGFVLSFLFLDPEGAPLPLDFVAHAAASRDISLRTGCMCNPGGAAALLGLRPLMARLGELPDASLAALELMAGRTLGVVRVSLGLASSFEDAWRVLCFARELADERARAGMWAAWKESAPAHA
jgi:molybdenum cofactor sulfurtransferase